MIILIIIPLQTSPIFFAVHVKIYVYTPPIK